MSYRSFVLHTPATRHTRPHRGASAARRYSTSLNDLETAVRRDRGVADICVTKVAVEQVEQRVEALDGRHDVATVGRVRAKAETDRGRNGLVAEAREPETA